MAAPTVWKARREPGAQFLLAWLVPSWLVFEAVITKLPHYVLPLYPAIAILIAGILDRGVLSRARWMRPGLAGWFIFPGVIALGIPIVFFMFNHDLGLVAWPFAAAAVIFGLFAWRLYDVDGPERALLRGMVAALFMSATVYAIAFPALPALFPSELVVEAVRATGCKDAKLVSTYAYQEPSLIFLLGTDTRFTDALGAAEFLNKGACRFALVDKRNERSFIQRADALGLRYTPAQTIDGFNISIGKPVVMSLFRSVERAMSALNGLHDGAELSPLRRFGFNITAAFRCCCGRRAAARCWPRDGRRAALLAGAALAAFFLCMVLLDAASIRAVGRLPPGVPWFFDQITDYGKSGWFLWPLGVLLLVLAVLPRSRLTHVSQRVLAAVTVRVGFLFLAIAVPGLFINIVKKICGRARPLVPGNYRSLRVRSVQLERGLCQPAVGARHDGILGAGGVRHRFGRARGR